MKIKGITWKANKFAFAGKRPTGKLYRFVNPVNGKTWLQEVNIFGRRSVRMVKIHQNWYVIGPPGKEYHHALSTYLQQGYADTQFQNTWLYKHIYQL